MKNRFSRLAALGMLTALVVVLQTAATFIRFGSFPITLTLIPIVVAGALYGVGSGALIGTVFGLVVLVMVLTGADASGQMMLALHPQGSVIYPGPDETAPPGAHALAQAFSDASGYPVEPVPPESANAGFKDWFLQVFKRPAFTIEAGLGENPLPTSQLPEITRALSAIFTAAMQW